MKKIHSKDKGPMAITTNVAGYGKSVRSSASKATENKIFRSTQKCFRAHRDEEFSDTCCAIVESEINNLASELEALFTWPKPKVNEN